MEEEDKTITLKKKYLERSETIPYLELPRTYKLGMRAKRFGDYCVTLKHKYLIA